MTKKQRRKRVGGIAIPTKRELRVYRAIILQHQSEGYVCALRWDDDLGIWSVVCDPLPVLIVGDAEEQ